MSVKIERICGIYKITSPSGRIYIGQADHIYKRWKMYETVIYRTKHRGQPHLYNSLLKYGVSNHKFEIVETCTADLLDEKEQFYIKQFGTFKTPHGMNCTAGGGGRRGYILSEESKRKISEGNMGRSYSETTINKMKDAANKTWAKRKANGDDRHKESTKKKMSDTLRRKYSNGYVSPVKGRKQSEELINKRRVLMAGEKNPMYGIKKTEEQKNAQRLKLLGRKGVPCTEERKRQLREDRLGKKASEETRAKMRIAHKRRNMVGENHPNYGKEPSSETRKKQSVSMTAAWEKLRVDSEYNSNERKQKRSDSQRRAWIGRKLSKNQIIIKYESNNSCVN